MGNSLRHEQDGIRRSLPPAFLVAATCVLATSSVAPMALAATCKPIAASAASAFTRLVRSPEYWSGAGSEFSQWYTVRAEPPPAGYSISRATFRLVGDRRCVGDDSQRQPACGWAQAQLVARGPYDVVWQFRMQGHDESKQLTRFFVTFELNDKQWSPVKVDVAFDGKKATSVGTIESLYEPESGAVFPATLQWSIWREEWSAQGRDYSGTYTIQTEPAPRGYELESARFDLAGEYQRACSGSNSNKNPSGSFARCRELAFGAGGVQWGFSIQGREDGNRATAARATLTSTFRLTTPPPRSYVVKQGDSLSRIARRELGSERRWVDLRSVNRAAIPDADHLCPGQVLVLGNRTHP